MKTFHTDNSVDSWNEVWIFLLGNRKNMQPVQFAKTKSVHISGLRSDLQMAY